MAEPKRIPVAIVRGGTSRGVVIEAEHLPPPGDARDSVIRRVFGSPDPRQVDGLGGADILTSKVAIVGAPTMDGADLDYTFGQVGIDRPFVDYDANCGNISAGVALYAAEQGYADRGDGPDTHVRIHNTNTRKLITARVTAHDHASTGAEVLLDYSATAGAVTGSLLPAGATRAVAVPGGPTLQMSLVDFANPVVYLAGADVGLTGREDHHWPDAHPDVIRHLEHVRGVAAVACGLADSPASAHVQAPTVPYVSLVWPCPGRRAPTVRARVVAVGTVHRAYPGTGMANLGAASLAAGTVVQRILGLDHTFSGQIVIEHPEGRAEVLVEAADPAVPAARPFIGYRRTARRICDGVAYL